MTDTPTVAKGLTLQTIGGNPNTWGTILNETLDKIDAALGQQVTVAIAADVTLTALQAEKVAYKFTGTPGANKTVTWPTFYGPLIARNAITDGSIITCGMASGLTVAVPAGESVMIFSDGIDFIQISASSGVNEVATIAALRAAAPPGAFAMVAVAGYYVAGDKAPVMYGYSTASSATDDGGYVIKPTSVAGGDPGRWLLMTLGQPFNVQDWGADPAGILPCDTQFAAWLAAIIAHGAAGYIPAGNYIFDNSAYWDLTDAATTGVKIFGDGVETTTLNFLNASGNPNLLIGGSAGELFFSSFCDFTVWGSIVGTVLRFGHADLSDQLNWFSVDLEVKNDSADASAVAVQFNAYAKSPYTRLIAKTGGGGDVVQLYQAQGNNFYWTWWNGKAGVHYVTPAASNGNVYHAVNFTNIVGNPVLCNSAAASHETFLGGLATWHNGSTDGEALMMNFGGDYFTFVGTVFDRDDAGANTPIAAGSAAAVVRILPEPGISYSIDWFAATDPNNRTIAIINEVATVAAIIGNVETAVGAAATVSVFKAPSGTAASAGTVLHSGSFDANGTAATNQTLTLVGGATDVLAAGDRLCLQTTGGANWTGGTGIGSLTVFLTPP